MALSKKHYIYCKVIITLGTDEPMKIFDDSSKLNLTPEEKMKLREYRDYYTKLDSQGKIAERKRIASIYFGAEEDEITGEYQKDMVATEEKKTINKSGEQTPIKPHSRQSKHKNRDSLEEKSIITLEDNSKFYLAYETEQNGKKYYLGNRLDEEEDPTDVSCIFEEIINNGNVYLNVVTDEKTVNYVTAVCTGNFVDEVNAMPFEESETISESQYTIDDFVEEPPTEQKAIKTKSSKPATPKKTVKKSTTGDIFDFEKNTEYKPPIKKS